MKPYVLIASLVFALLTFVGCQDGRTSAIPLNSTTVPPILLFTGNGISPNDARAVETILDVQHLSYSTANSSQMNDMTESRLQAYKLLIIPGGNYEEIGRGLLPSTSAKIRHAVQNGLNYFGICAGGFFAGNSTPNGLNLTSGVRFGFYSAEERGIRKAALAISGVNVPALDQYWEDGPQFTGWGSVVGKYPDGTPAIVEGNSGKGWMILSGIHAEAPASWRNGMNFGTPASIDNDYAATLIRATLDRTRLPHF